MGTGRTGRPTLDELDFADAPFLVIREVTRACDLACLHCRAEAVRHRHPLELTTDEARRLLDRVRAFGRYRRSVDAGTADPVGIYFARRNPHHIALLERKE